MGDLCTGIVWDLDDTLYQQTAKGKVDWLHAIAQAALQMGVDLSHEEAYEQARSSYHALGAGHAAFLERYDLPKQPFIEAIMARAPIGEVFPCPLTTQAVRQTAAHDMAILSAGYRPWVDKVLHRLGLNDHFLPAQVLSCEDVGHASKARDERPFHDVAAAMQRPLTALVMVEDNINNLEIPRALGMRTVLITHTAGPHAAPRHVDFVVEKAYHVFDLIKQGLIPWHSPRNAPAS